MLLLAQTTVLQMFLASGLGVFAAIKDAGANTET